MGVHAGLGGCAYLRGHDVLQETSKGRSFDQPEASEEISFRDLAPTHEREINDALRELEELELRLSGATTHTS